MPATPKFIKKGIVNLKLPALGKPPNYAAFVNEVYKMPGNVKVLAVVNNWKSVIDMGYQTLLRERFKHDDISIWKYMDETTTKAAKEQWKSRKGHINRFFGDATSVSAEAKQPKTPTVGKHSKHNCGKGKSNDEWDRQTYKYFAIKTERLNPGTSFTRTLMDGAFKYAVSLVQWRIDKGRFTRAEAQKCTARYAEHESERYWKDR